MKRRDFLSTFLAASATLLPLATAAQQRAGVRRIAIVNPSGSAERLTEESNRRYYGPFFEELRRLGYVEGQNLTVLRYSGEGRPDNYTELARTVVDAAPELIFVVTGRLTSYFKAATTTLPLLPSPPTRLCRDSPPIWRGQAAILRGLW